jgi:hypothetical protein
MMLLRASAEDAANFFISNFRSARLDPSAMDRNNDDCSGSISKTEEVVAAFRFTLRKGRESFVLICHRKNTLLLTLLESSF